MTRPASLLAACILTALYCLASAVGLKPGKYQVSTRTAIAGHEQDGQTTKTRCITAADLDDPERIFNERFLDAYKPDPTCILKNLQNTEGRLSYDEECSNRLIHVEATVFETEYAAVRNVNPKSGSSLPFTYTMTAKRAGDCKE